MDIRVGNLPKIRVLPKRENSAHGNALSASEAMAERTIETLRPGLVWIYGLRRRLATISVLVLTGWLFVHVMFGANGMMVYRAKRTELQSLQKEIDSLQKENDRHSKQIDDLKTNPKTIEKAAREQLHYARPGEVVYVAPAPLKQEVPRTDAAQK
jgi:cell division protein FtsB